MPLAIVTLMERFGNDNRKGSCAFMQTSICAPTDEGKMRTMRDRKAMKRDDGTHALANQRFVADSSLPKMMPRPIANSPQ